LSFGSILTFKPEVSLAPLLQLHKLSDPGVPVCRRCCLCACAGRHEHADTLACVCCLTWPQ
jgi:hypothetical protein